jgi:hypothetical protein
MWEQDEKMLRALHVARDSRWMAEFSASVPPLERKKKLVKGEHFAPVPSFLFFFK